MTSKEETRQAVIECIEHWCENEVVQSVYKASASAVDCALCALFINYSCQDCPLQKAVGKCGGDALTNRNPWMRACRARKTWRDRVRRNRSLGYQHKARAEFHKASRAMRETLENVLEGLK